MGVVIDHHGLDRIEMVLQLGNKNHEQVYRNWLTNHFQRVFEWDVATTGRKDRATTRSIRFYKEALGRQDTCVTFRHRNWVWARLQEEDWLLYADRRGPSLHVRSGSTPAEAFKAFQNFRNHIDNYFKEAA